MKNRVLSLALALCMIISLLPAVSLVGAADTTYVYDFNDGTVASYAATESTTADYTFKNADGSAWMFLKANASAGGYPKTNGSGTSASFMWQSQYRNRSWVALQFKVPAAGEYSLKLLHLKAAAFPATANVYLIPENSGYSLPADRTAIDSKYLVSSKFDSASEQTLELTSVNVSDESNDEFILVVYPTNLTTTGETSGDHARIFLKSLTLTKTAGAGGNDGEETQEPIKLSFDKNTVSIDNESKALNTLSAVGTQNFSFVNAKTESRNGSSSVQDYGLLINNFRANGVTGKNWLSCVTDSEYMANEENDKYAGRLTLQAKDIPAGTYKVSAEVKNFNRGSGVYYYVNGEYLGYDDSYLEKGETYKNAELLSETIGYVTIADNDGNPDNANPVEIALCSAAVDYEDTANLYILKSITFTPEEIPSAETEVIDCTINGEAAENSYEISVGETLDVSAMLTRTDADGNEIPFHLNGYTIEGAKDHDNCIKVSSSNEGFVSVTYAGAALDSERIYNSSYNPVYTLTALKPNAVSVITAEAIVDGESVAKKSFVVRVAGDSGEESAQSGYSFVYSFNLDGSTGTKLNTMGYDNTHNMWSYSEQTTSGMAATATHGRFGIQTGIRDYNENEWLALNLNVPFEGRYSISFIRGESHTYGGYGDIYLFRPGTKITAELLKASEPVNSETISYFTSPSSVVQASPITICESFDIDEAGEWIAVFKQTGVGGGGGAYMYLHALTLNGGPTEL